MERLEFVFKLSHRQIVTLLSKHLAFQVSSSYVPSCVVVVHDLEEPEPLSFQCLFEKLELQ